MKTSNITKSALALALGLCASGAWALTTTNAFENFNSYADGTKISGLNASQDITWSAGADAAEYSYVNGSTHKLVVDTGDSSVTGALSNATAFNNNIANSASFEAKVTFTPATETPSVGGSDLKFALYAKAGTGTTNLYVYANGGETNTEIAVAANTEKTVKVDFFSDSTFKVSVDGSAAAGPYNFANSGTISKVEFQGNGEVDDLAFTYNATPYTMTWVADSASYIVDGVTNSLAGESSPFTYYGEPGQTVKIIGKKGYMTGEATVVAGAGTSTALVLDSYSTDLADYFANGEGTAANPYQIATANDLIALKDAVANVEAARSKSYIQTANIDMASAGAFAGIGTYAAVPTSGTPFTGTYDGGNYKIKNIDFTQRNYGGVFNQVNGGTIKNLTVSNITCSTFSTSANDGEWGCAIIGNAGNGATLQNLVAEGDFGTTARPCSHNVAGIAIRLSRGNTNTLVTNCVNNAALHGTYTKLGGICALTQRQDAQKDFTGSVVFDSCVNNGTITATANANGKNPGVDGIAGIVGYTADNTIVQNCSNTGSFSSTYASAAIGEIIGKGAGEDKGTLTDNGGNSGDASKKLIANPTPARVNGFMYATVDNGVATTISGSIAAGNTYLIERAAEPTIELSNGQWIAFDKSLNVTLTETGITAATGCEVTPSGTDTRRFDSAYVTVAVSYSAALEHLTAAWKVNNASVAEAPATLTYGNTYEVTFEAAEGWQIVSGAVNPVTGTADTTAITITVPAVEQITVGVSYSAALTHLTAAWTVNGSSVAEPATLTYGDTYSVTFTAESGWAISDGAVNPVSGTAGTTAIVITVPAVEELPSYAAGDTTVIEDHTLTGDEADYLNDLVSTKGASAVETALASIDEDDFVAAALLNQDITENNAGSYEFKVSSLKKKAGGKVEVKVTLTRSGSVLGKIKGTVVLKTCATPNGTYVEFDTQELSGEALAEATFDTEAADTATTQEFTATFTGVTDKFFKAEIK